ncbi:hypothetical protein BU15DRAFT_68506 [Melanogaster broomeanus]|nr:hypothetical protein BU15DRAFT_68506 [Melanogaster broomeanus]
MPCPEPKCYMRGANIVCVAHPSMKVLPTTQIPASAATLGHIAGKPIDKHGLIGSVELWHMPMHATTTCSHDDDDSPTCTQHPIMVMIHGLTSVVPANRAPQLRTPPTHHNDTAAAHVPPQQSFPMHPNDTTQPRFRRRNAAAIPMTQRSCDSDNATCPHSQLCTRAPPPTHHNNAAAAHVPPQQLLRCTYIYNNFDLHGLAKDRLRLVYNQSQQIHKNIETKTETARFGGNWQPKSSCQFFWQSLTGL